MSGTVVVRQHAGRVAAIGMRGGTVMIYGNAGSRAGYAMKGGLLIVAGQAGAMAGHYMMGGRMILLGPAAEGLGDGMLGGEIYVAGNVSSLGRRTTRTEVAEREYREIMEALMLWGLDAGHHFRKVVPASAGPPGSVHPEGGRIE
jgi:glutamate synthase domain-containing protein 3